MPVVRPKIKQIIVTIIMCEDHKIFAYRIPIVDHHNTCTVFHRYKSGLVALHGLLCLGEVSESNFVHRYGNETGVALHLLGMLNLRLNQTKEAVRHFRAALKYNPFLWSAFEKLCDLGGSLDCNNCTADYNDACC